MSIGRIRFAAGAALVGAAAALGIAWAHPQEPRAGGLVTHRWIQQFGMVTPALGETLRLHAVHLVRSSPPAPNTPPAPYPPTPCSIVLAFFDSQGNMIGNPTFATLDAGASTFVDLSFGASAPNAFPPSPCRAAVWVSLNSPAGHFPPNPCQATLELIGTANGSTAVHMLPAVQDALADVLP